MVIWLLEVTVGGDRARRRETYRAAPILGNKAPLTYPPQLNYSI